MKKVLFLIVIFFASNHTFSQSKKIKEFSKESKEYIDDINTFMLSGSASEDIKKMMKSLVSYARCSATVISNVCTKR